MKRMLFVRDYLRNERDCKAIAKIRVPIFVFRVVRFIVACLDTVDRKDSFREKCRCV